MILSKKRTCNNCIADRGNMGCELGYKNKFIPLKGCIPLEPCLKPLTNKQYLEAYFSNKNYNK